MPYPALARQLALLLLATAGPLCFASRDCDSPPAAWQPRSAVQALAERNGWTLDRLKIDDGCYEIRGRDQDGRPFKAKLDPASLQVLRMRRGEHGHHDADRDRLRDRRGASSPPSPPASSSGVRE